MLYDPKWFKTAPPTKPQEPWRHILLDAADLIERKGHCKNRLTDHKGRICLIKAMSLALDEQVERFHAYEYEKARTEIAKVVGNYDVIAWNNKPERTAEEVIGALRTAAVS